MNLTKSYFCWFYIACGLLHLVKSYFYYFGLAESRFIYLILHIAPTLLHPNHLFLICIKLVTCSNILKLLLQYMWLRPSGFLLLLFLHFMTLSYITVILVLLFFIVSGCSRCLYIQTFSEDTFKWQCIRSKDETNIKWH